MMIYAAQILLDSSSHLLSHFFFLWKIRCVNKQKHLVQDLILPTSQHKYIYVYFVHIYKYIYAEIQSIWIFRALQVSRPDLWAHILVIHVQCVCV